MTRTMEEGRMDPGIQEGGQTGLQKLSSCHSAHSSEQDIRTPVEQTIHQSLRAIPVQ